MGFLQYSQLPLELRLQVIEEFIKIPDELGYRTRLAPFTCVHSEWNHVIELSLFKKMTITNLGAKEFGRICGVRQNLLDKISLKLVLYDMDESDDCIQNQQIITENVSELFHAVKDWSRADR